MRGWTIRRQIIASFGLILGLMVVMAAFAYVRLTRVERETEALQTDSLPGVYYGAAVMDAWSSDFSLIQERLANQDPAERRKVDAKLASGRSVLDKAVADYEPTSIGADDRRLFDAFESARIAYERVEDELLRLGGDDKGRLEGERQLVARLATEFDRGDVAIKKAVAFNKATSDASARQIAEDAASAKAGVLVSLLVALALAIACGVSLFRAIIRPLGTLTSVVDIMRRGDFTRRITLDRHDEFGAVADGFNRMTDELTALVGDVQKSGIRVNTSVTEIAATSKEQQATANEVAATTTEIGATSREISATSKELVKTMSDVSAVAEQTATVAGTGQVGLTHMEDVMRHVMDAAGSVNAKLETLNERAADISQVVTTITKVADQTNLLSLNAAIEAEKAGEYGRGFAVVATEIRRLADQTAVATLDIDRMVKAIQSAVSAGVMSMDKFSEEVRRGMQAVQEVGGVLSQVIQQTQALAPRFEAVSEGMQTQAIGAEQITEALTQLSEAARQTVESLRQSNLAISELNQVVAGLRSGVSRFTLQAV